MNCLTSKIVFLRAKLTFNPIKMCEGDEARFRCGRKRFNWIKVILKTQMACFIIKTNNKKKDGHSPPHPWLCHSLGKGAEFPQHWAFSKRLAVKTLISFKQFRSSHPALKPFSKSFVRGWRWSSVKVIGWLMEQDKAPHHVWCQAGGGVFT